MPVAVSQPNPRNTPESDDTGDVVRIARRVLLSERQIVGFVPASTGIQLQALVTTVAQTLSGISAHRVVIVDPLARWSLWEHDSGTQAPATNNASVIRGCWLSGTQLAAIAPRTIPSSEDVFRTLQGLLSRASRNAEHVLVDLGALVHNAQYLAGLRLVDAVCLVARSGKTTKEALERTHRDLQEAHTLGVVLVD
jgi:hypothetical protein